MTWVIILLNIRDGDKKQANLIIIEKLLDLLEAKNPY